MLLISLVKLRGSRLKNLAYRLLQQPRIMLYRLLSNAQIRGKPILFQPMQVVGQGIVEFSGQVKIGVFPSPFFFSTYTYIEARNSTASVVIGDGTWINNNFCAIAEHSSITIGKRVLIGAGVEIFDSDFHGLSIKDRNESNPAWAKPVVIEDDVFLGSNVKILKGVTIGRGSIVANSAVVVKSIPSHVIAGGNPAKLIKPLG